MKEILETVQVDLSLITEENKEEYINSLKKEYAEDYFKQLKNIWISQALCSEWFSDNENQNEDNKKTFELNQRYMELTAQTIYFLQN